MCQCSVLVTILAAAAAVRATWSDESAASEICPKDAQSCSATAYDSCCVPQNGLLVLALQWLPGYCANTKSCNHGAVDRLPSDKWTIHGLWPDTCDGYQVSDCDSNRVYPNTETLLKNSTIEDDMHSFWVSFTGDFNTFWK
ncbi:ribonuclease T2-like protein [Zopfochytrium polystomum]|nr:ribonuclease T2-like protein [Zopfochytrium polystomum]